MRTSRRSFLTAASTAITLAMPAVARGADAAKPVRIGSLADLSGASSTDTGPITIYAAQLAIDDFGGQVLGRPIELLTIDDQNNPDIGVGAARKWLDADGASAIVSNTLSSIAINVKKLCEDRQKVLLIGTSASSVFSQQECSRALVIFGVNTYCMPKGVVSALLQRGLDSWFFITADYAFGHALEADAWSFVTQGGGRVLGAVRAPVSGPGAASGGISWLRGPAGREQPAVHSCLEHQRWTCAPAVGHDGCPVGSRAFERPYRFWQASWWLV